MRQNLSYRQYSMSLSTDYTRTISSCDSDAYLSIWDPNNRLPQMEVVVSLSRAREIVSNMSEKSKRMLLELIREGIFDPNSLIKIRHTASLEPATIKVRDFWQAVCNEELQPESTFSTPERLREVAFRLEENGIYASLNSITWSTYDTPIGAFDYSIETNKFKRLMTETKARFLRLYLIMAATVFQCKASLPILPVILSVATFTTIVAVIILASKEKPELPTSTIGRSSKPMNTSIANITTPVNINLFGSSSTSIASSTSTVSNPVTRKTDTSSFAPLDTSVGVSKTSSVYSKKTQASSSITSTRRTTSLNSPTRTNSQSKTTHTSTMPTEQQCPDGWILSPIVANKCYLFVGTTTLVWFDAKSYCNHTVLGADLVSICSPFENADIGAIAFDRLGKSTEPLWIGLNDIANSGIFNWTDSCECTYRNWAPDEPANISHCVSSQARWDGLWSTENCGRERYFICEYYINGAGSR